MNTTALATHDEPETLRDRLLKATDKVAARIKAAPLSEDDAEQLDSDDGLQVDGCAIWMVGHELRSFTSCNCCGDYAELDVDLRMWGWWQQ